MREDVKKTLRIVLKIVKYLAITIGVLWALLIILLQIVLSDKFLKRTVDKLIPQYVEDAQVSYTRISASALKSFPNLRLTIDSVCITYPHDKFAHYDSIPGPSGRLDNLGRAPEADTLACFSSISVSVSYLSLLRGKIVITDFSLKDARVFARQLDSLKGNWGILKFLAPQEDDSPSSLPNIILRRLGVKGKTVAVYTNKADTVFAAIMSRNIEMEGELALLEPFKAKLKLDIDSLFVSGRTATDTIAAGLKRLSLNRRRRFHDLSAQGGAFVSMGGSGRMMLPLKVDGSFSFPNQDGSRLVIQNMRFRSASFSLTASSDLAFYDDSTGIKAIASVDSCNAGKILKDFAALLPQEARSFDSNADISLKLTCDGVLKTDPLRLPDIVAKLCVPKSYIRHKDVESPGRLAADIEFTAGKKRLLDAKVNNLDFAFAGVELGGHIRATELLGDDPHLYMDTKGYADLEKISTFLPEGMLAHGIIQAKLKGDARVSEFGPGNFAGANLDGFIYSDSISVRDDYMNAYLGKTDIQLAKKKRKKGSEEAILIVEGKIDSVFAGFGPVTKIRGRSLDLAISDIDASIGAERLSMLGEDSLFLALKNTRNYLSIDNSMMGSDAKVSSIMMSSDNERLFIRQGKTAIGFGEARLMTTGNKRSKVQMQSRREKLLDSLQRIWPGVPRDSLFAKMMRTRSRNVNHRRYAGLEDKAFSSQDISIRLDESLSKYFTDWNIDGYLNIEKGFAISPYFPLRTRLSAFRTKFNNDQVEIDSIGVKAGKSDIGAHAKLSGLRRALRRRGTLKLDMNVHSNSLNANELLSALDAGSRYSTEVTGASALSEAELSESDATSISEVDSAAKLPLIVVPSNLNVNIGITGDTIKYSSLLIDSFSSSIVMKERCLQLSSTTATSNMGNISLEGFYSTRSRKDLSVGFDLNLRDITADKVISLIPQVDTLLPLLKSFQGNLDCEFAATSDLDTNMNFVKNSISGLMQIYGSGLSVEQTKEIRKITKLLLFKNRKTWNVDEMYVKGIIGNNTLEIFPFSLSLDRYKLAIGGWHNFDGEFKYHVSMLKSPVPFKFGLSIKGNADDWSWHTCKPKYTKIDTPVYTRQLDTARMNLLSSIRNIFDKGVSLALRENRSEISVIQRDSTSVPRIDIRNDAADTLTREELIQIDSLRIVQDSLEIQNNIVNLQPLSDSECDSFPRSLSAMGTCYCLPKGFAGVLKLVDKPDLGSGASGVWVRVPSPAHNVNESQAPSLAFSLRKYFDNLRDLITFA